MGFVDPAEIVAAGGTPVRLKSELEESRSTDDDLLALSRIRIREITPRRPCLSRVPAPAESNAKSSGSIRLVQKFRCQPPNRDDQIVSGVPLREGPGAVRTARPSRNLIREPAAGNAALAETAAWVAR